MTTLHTRLRRAAPLGAVAALCAASLINLRPQLTEVPYLNDSAMQEEMVRFALAKLRAGHLPLDSWFPLLNLGSPQYLHYQSLGALITALLAWPIGVGRAFTLTTWLLVGCWPLCVYAAARLFSLGRGAALAAAVLAPFVSSATGVGYEQMSYLWSGFGLWSQLWAMWTLPLAWACSWRAVEERRLVVPAALLVAATAAFHFETGYLAFAGVAVAVVVRPSGGLARLGRGALVAGGAFALDAWAIVPLVAQGRWAAVNQFLQSGPEGVDANSYGARTVLRALVEGDILDWHHLALVTPLFAVGLVCCAADWRRGRALAPGLSRLLVALFSLCLLLYFGRPTLGPLLDLLPGATELFLRRFIVGVQLSALLLAGVGTALTCSAVMRLLRNVRLPRALRPLLDARTLATAVCVLTAVVTLVPAASFLREVGERDAVLVARQAKASRSAAELDALLGTIARRGGGRTFAGDPGDFGADFTVGEVPVFKYLASRDVDEVGFTLRTASLMSDPEVDFDDTNPADYVAFGIRWIIVPATMAPPVPATFVERRGRYTLFGLPHDRVIEVVDSRGSIAAGPGDLASFAAGFLAALPGRVPIFPTVAYAGARAPAGSLGERVVPSDPPGTVQREWADLDGGTVDANVALTRRAVVLLAASYDPGWQASVDGRRVPTEMIAPAFVGVVVPAGNHTVRFVYRGFPDYPQLFTVAALALAALIATERRSMRRRSS